MKNEIVLKELSTAELKERLETERATYQKMIARCLTELRAREIAGNK